MLLPIVALVFLSVLCLLIAAGFYLSDRHSSASSELKRRLQRMARTRTTEPPDELRATLKRETDRAGRFLARFTFARDLSRKLDLAGIEATAVTFVAVTGSAALVVAGVTVLRSGMVLMGLAAAACVAMAALLFLRVKIEKRNRKFTEEFPEALAIISRSLRAGHSFTTAVQLVGQEIAPPVGQLFRAAYDQQQLGLRMNDALAAMNQKIDSLDLRFFTTVISVNADVGGNLADVLDKLAFTIRDRLRIRRQVQVYTAQGRMSGYVLGALPVFAFAGFSLLNPQYESALLKEPMGRYVLVFAGLMQVVGMLIIRKIIRIRI